MVDVVALAPDKKDFSTARAAEQSDNIAHAKVPRLPHL